MRGFGEEEISGVNLFNGNGTREDPAEVRKYQKGRQKNRGKINAQGGREAREA